MLDIALGCAGAAGPFPVPLLTSGGAGWWNYDLGALDKCCT